MQVIAVILFLGFSYGTWSQSVVETSDDGNSGKISFSTPDLSDDESHSPWMPDQLKCDGCRAIAYQLWRTYSKFNEKRKSLKYELRESDILDLSETLCLDTKGTWEGYGLKEVKKVKRLSGAGLETSDVPGVTAGGGKWPGRLADMCDTYMGELGETTIYDVYKKHPKSSKKLENYLCRGEGLRGECTKAENQGNQKDEL